MNKVNRRDFIKTSAGAAALSTSALGFNISNYSSSPNGTVRVAVVGLRGQGGAHTSNYLKMQGVEIAALCDIDDAQFAKHEKQIEAAGKTKPKIYKDIRKLLEDKDIDAVSIATPNHWHSLQGIWTLQAGKDLYLEKPLSQSYWEGKQLVAAAKKYGKVVQHGTNSRSGVAIREAMQKMHKEDLIGDIYYTRALCYKWRDTIGKKADGPVPAGVDYDMWLGPAPKRPFNENRFHYNWHWNWDYGNGDLGNQGIHEVDISRWGLGVTLPTKVSAIGGHFMFDDDQNTPNTLVATFEFDKNGKKAMMVAEVRHWITNNEAGISDAPDLKMGAGGGRGGNTIGNIFYGSKGYLAIEGYTKYTTFLGKDQQPGPERTAPGNNWANFIEVVKSRKMEDLNAPIEEGHYSCALVHLANISYRTGRSINFDPKTEQIIGDKEASAMMKRQYRAPYVVPDKV
ncbi:MAG TPA: Gfo/Idh/MocA family oxidoreductase [Blastocatellia bacterium]|nr:Gfo/Idh/MocA family oxidoreductase [Blastocatellia bacterium]